MVPKEMLHDFLIMFNSTAPLNKSDVIQTRIPWYIKNLLWTNFLSGAHTSELRSEILTYYRLLVLYILYAGGEADGKLGCACAEGVNPAVQGRRESSKRNDWLAQRHNARGWCSSHHHLRCPKRVYSRKPYATMVSVIILLDKFSPYNAL